MVAMIPDQKKMWNSKHAKRPDSARNNEPDAFATSVIDLLNPGDKLLELGCGTGADSSFFAQNGIITLATDFSAEVIKKNQAQAAGPNPEFKVLDISGPFPYKDGSFDVVFAHLSLHYFTHKTTLSIFKEIHRVVKAGGLLAFRCKSTKDPKHGQGIEIEDNMFVRKGHVRHLFTTQYTKKLLKNRFSIMQLKETSGQYAGETSRFIDCVARKI